MTCTTGCSSLLARLFLLTSGKSALKGLLELLAGVRPINPNNRMTRVLRGILHDERHFPDPMTFNPDRWLASSPGYVTLTPECDGVTEKTGSTTIDPWSVAFGYGRRICPGIHVARTGLFLSMARILSSFEIRRKIDPITRMPIVPEAKWTGGSIRSVGLVSWLRLVSA